jgi:hypothetical protein
MINATLKPEDVDIPKNRITDGIVFNQGICKELYHGTKKYIVQKIRQANDIEFGKEPGYIGCGLYCYLHDIMACKIMAKRKYGNEKIAILNVIANLGSVLYISYEVREILKKSILKKSKSYSARVNEYIGMLIEDVIDGLSKKEHSINIDTVAQSHNIRIDGRRQRAVTMYCLRNKRKIKKISLCWEE